MKTKYTVALLVTVMLISSLAGMKAYAWPTPHTRDATYVVSAVDEAGSPKIEMPDDARHGNAMFIDDNFGNQHPFYAEPGDKIKTEITITNNTGRELVNVKMKGSVFVETYDYSEFTNVKIYDESGAVICPSTWLSTIDGIEFDLIPSLANGDSYKFFLEFYFDARGLDNQFMGCPYGYYPEFTAEYEELETEFSDVIVNYYKTGTTTRITDTSGTVIPAYTANLEVGTTFTAPAPTNPHARWIYNSTVPAGGQIVVNLNASLNVINLYYDEAALVTVNYYVLGTTTRITDTSNNIIPALVTYQVIGSSYTAPFAANPNASWIYNSSVPSGRQITVSADEANNVINLYYTVQEFTNPPDTPTPEPPTPTPFLTSTPTPTPTPTSTPTSTPTVPVTPVVTPSETDVTIPPEETAPAGEITVPATDEPIIVPATPEPGGKPNPVTGDNIMSVAAVLVLSCAALIFVAVSRNKGKDK